MNTESTSNTSRKFTGQRYYYPSREELHKRFGGYVCNSDFEIGNYHSMSDYAERVIRDHRFDDMCRKDYERNKAYKERRKCDKT